MAPKIRNEADGFDTECGYNELGEMDWTHGDCVEDYHSGVADPFEKGGVEKPRVPKED